jgi:hypothetical protein
MPSSPASSIRPMNGETYAAPARAASSDWFAEKISVVLTLMPSADSRPIACRPCSVIAIFTITFGCHEAMRRPSSTSASAVVEMHSAEMGPSTTSQISSTRSRYSMPSFATSEGLVVTPSTTPIAAPRRMSSILAVSRKSRISPVLSRHHEPGGCRPQKGL